MEEKGWKEFLQQYGTLSAMVSLAAEHGDMNLGHIRSALGDPEKVRELLEIPLDQVSKEELEKLWRWKVINLPAKEFRAILEEVRREGLSKTLEKQEAVSSAQELLRVLKSPGLMEELLSDLV